MIPFKIISLSKNSRLVVLITIVISFVVIRITLLLIAVTMMRLLMAIFLLEIPMCILIVTPNLLVRLRIVLVPSLVTIMASSRVLRLIGIILGSRWVRFVIIATIIVARIGLITVRCMTIGLKTRVPWRTMPRRWWKRPSRMPMTQSRLMRSTGSQGRQFLGISLDPGRKSRRPSFPHGTCSRLIIPLQINSRKIRKTNAKIVAHRVFFDASIGFFVHQI
jgi:hypothetical protein